jgi:hypothetical protein
MASRIGVQSQCVGALTKEAIFDKVMRGQHLTSAEKEFVRNGYRVIDRPVLQETDQGTSPRDEWNLRT